jgi:hypothetical protein
MARAGTAHSHGTWRSWRGSPTPSNRRTTTPASSSPSTAVTPPVRPRLSMPSRGRWRDAARSGRRLARPSRRPTASRGSVAAGVSHESFNYDALTARLLRPFREGALSLQSASFDLRADTPSVAETCVASPAAGSCLRSVPPASRASPALGRGGVSARPRAGHPQPGPSCGTPTNSEEPNRSADSSSSVTCQGKRPTATRRHPSTTPTW